MSPIFRLSPSWMPWSYRNNQLIYRYLYLSKRGHAVLSKTPDRPQSHSFPCLDTLIQQSSAFFTVTRTSRADLEHPLFSVTQSFVRTLSSSTSSAIEDSLVGFKVIKDEVDKSSPSFIETVCISELAAESLSEMVKRVEAGAGPKAVAKHTQVNKKLLARDRVHKLVDSEADFLEVGQIAGMGMKYGDIPRAGILLGISKVFGVYCMILANDATIKGGTLYPVSVQKQLRGQELARRLKLPCIYLVDSGGAFLPFQADIFPDRAHGGRVFYNEAVMSSENIPQVAYVCGSCTAGGAYIPTMADEAVIVKGVGHIFLGGPPLVKAALGEIISAEELGGATLHSQVSGCTDHYAVTEEEGLKVCRDVIASLDQTGHAGSSNISYEDPLYPSSDLPGLLSSTDTPSPLRQVIARLVDGSRFQEFKELFGPNLITGFAHIEGHMTGVVASNGPLDKTAAEKGAHFVSICSSRGLPVTILQDTQLDEVTQQDPHMLVAHSKMMAALACCDAPVITVVVGSSCGSDSMVMGSRSMNPLFLFAWPQSTVSPRPQCDLSHHSNQHTEFKEDEMREREQLEAESTAMYGAANLWVDAIIFPEQTRKTIAQCLSIIASSQKIPARRTLSQGVIRM